jgi:hypothetical protein
LAESKNSCHDQGKKNLRPAIKEMALTSSGKVLSEKAIFDLVHVLNERPGLRFTAVYSENEGVGYGE